MKDRKTIIIIGAGPGGLTAGMLLAHAGHRVIMYEKDLIPGGRNKHMELGPYTFDVGPTFFMMKYILDEVFTQTGRHVEDYLTFYRLDPMYRLLFEGSHIDVTDNHKHMDQRLHDAFAETPGQFLSFMGKEEERFRALSRLFQTDNSRLLNTSLLKALPYLSAGKSLFDVIGETFKNDQARLTFTFGSKYLGMSPWDCPGAFTMIPYVEHAFGIYHIEGGLNKISKAMAQVVKEEGGTIHYGTSVARILSKNGRAYGVELNDGSQATADAIIVNPDFSWATTHLFKPGALKKYTPKYLAKKRYSCSTVLLYLGLDTLYNIPHHTIIFAKEYKKNLEEIYNGRITAVDASIYVHNPSITDPTLAPAGHSALYILIPVPNCRSGIDWDAQKLHYREQALRIIQERMGLKDIESHIKAEKMLTPQDFESDYHVHIGAVFNLAHNLGQMMYFRPHNQFEEMEHVYLVGGGTHPGSGLPTIYESGRIAARLIEQKHRS